MRIKFDNQFKLQVNKLITRPITLLRWSLLIISVSSRFTSCAISRRKATLFRVFIIEIRLSWNTLFSQIVNEKGVFKWQRTEWAWWAMAINTYSFLLLLRLNLSTDDWDCIREIFRLLPWWILRSKYSFILLVNCHLFPNLSLDYCWNRNLLSCFENLVVNCWGSFSMVQVSIKEWLQKLKQVNVSLNEWLI